MVPTHKRDKHGYLFFVLFGVIYAVIGKIGIELAEIPNDRPLNQVLQGWDAVLFFLGLAGCTAISYYLAVGLSGAIHRMFRRF